MLKKYIYYTLILFAMMFITQSCTKWDDYKKYTKDGEKVYPSKVLGIEAYSGNGRVLLTWKKEIDESVTKFGVFWNNGNKVSEVDVSSFKIGDTIKHYINDLNETNYSFTVYSYDAAGNKSIATELPPVKVYGTKYQAALLNRPVKKVSFSSETSLLTIEWGIPDKINLTTEVRYVDNLNIEKVLLLSPDDEVTIFSWKVGSKIYYKSTYIPVASSIDSFEVINQDSIVVPNVLH